MQRGSPALAAPSCHPILLSASHHLFRSVHLWKRKWRERGRAPRSSFRVYASNRKEGETMGANAGRLGQRSHDAGVSSCPGGLASPPPVPTTQLTPGYEATLR